MWLALAIPRARSITSRYLWFSASLTSMISSIDAGKSGNSSTEIMCNAAPQRLARSHDMASALKPPSEPSFATTIRVNTSDLLPCGADLRQEPFLGYQGRHHRAADDGRQQDRILTLVDNPIGQTV